MSSLLKNGLGEIAVRRQCEALKRALPTFPTEAYAKDALHGIEGMALKERVIHMARCLHAHLPKPAAEAVAASATSAAGKGKDAPPAKATADAEAEDFRRVAVPLLRKCAQPGVFPSPANVSAVATNADSDAALPSSMDAFAPWPFIDYVAMYGLGAPEEALPLLADMTHMFTAEFAIRPFAIKYFTETHAHALRWCDHPSEHVRRLASEGLRPRLPWGLRLTQLCADPTPLAPILDRLVGDPSLYVRKSVANNVNDISKDHPEFAVELCRRWVAEAEARAKQRAATVKGGSEKGDEHHQQKEALERARWVARHGARTLIKQGHPGALALFGHSTAAADLEGIVCPRLVLTKAGEAAAAANKKSSSSNNNKAGKEAKKAAPLLSIAVGESINMAFTVENNGPSAQSIVVDFAVHYARKGGSDADDDDTSKAGGAKKRARSAAGKQGKDNGAVESVSAVAAKPQSSRFRKVFKHSAVYIAAGGSVDLAKNISFRPITTRAYHEGLHTVEVLANGKTCATADFMLRL